MLRGYLQIPPHMVLDQLLDITRIFHRQIIANTGGNQYLLDPFEISGLAVEGNGRGVIGIHMMANHRIDAGGPATTLFSLWIFTSQTIHIRRRPTQIGNHTSKARHLVTDLFNFTKNRLLGAALDDPPLMLGDRAKRTSTKAATHDIDRGLDHLVGRDLVFSIRRMRHSLIRQGEDTIHLRGRKWYSWRIDPQQAITMFLC